jgi:rRNA maturation endonuclease Nob1
MKRCQTCKDKLPRVRMSQEFCDDCVFQALMRMLREAYFGTKKRSNKKS